MISSNPVAERLDIVRRMNRVQQHRGPDGEDVWTDDSAAVGHRRLAVIDLRACAAQPMSNEDDSLVLVCNGEIYNFRELRRDLERRGHQFKSQTDIEVILHLYEDKADDCVSDLVGMFAFALWDRRRRRLLLARDRIGEKPLYFAVLPHGLAFASEIAALLEVPNVDRTIDVDAVVAGLVYPSLPAPLTMFAGVRLLAPASRLVFESGRVEVQKYWRINGSARRRTDLTAAVHELHENLRRSVEGALIADVPVGVLLSGGVDSAAVAYHASRGGDIQTFSVGNERPGHPDPDLDRARAVAERLGLQHRIIPFSDVDVARLPAIVARYGQPFNVFPMLYADELARAVRTEVTVALGGNGGDEIFGGYRGYNRQLLAWRLDALIATVPLKVVNSAIGSARLKRFRTAAGRPVGERRARFMTELATQLGASLLAGRYTDAAATTDPGRFIAEYANECQTCDVVESAMYTDLMVSHQHGTTILPDVSGMTHSLEIRAPFLDHRIVEFAFELPRNWKVRSALRPNLNKWILKRSLEGKVPHEVLYGRKYGFGYSIDPVQMLRGPWRPLVEAFVSRGRFGDLGIFSTAAVQESANSPSVHTWRFLVFSIWAELFVFGERPERVSAQIADLLRHAAARVA